jgi:hypothetical protein
MEPLAGWRMLLHRVRFSSLSHPQPWLSPSARGDRAALSA